MTLTNNRRPAVMIGITLIVCAIVGSWWGYREYMVPRTPLVWQPIGPERVKTLLDCKHPILIRAQNVTSTPAESPFRRDLLESDTQKTAYKEEVRRFVHQYDVELLSYDYTTNYDDQSMTEGDNTALEFTKLLGNRRQELRAFIPEYILALPGHRNLYVIPYSERSIEIVMKGIRSNGETLDVNAYSDTRRQ